MMRLDTKGIAGWEDRTVVLEFEHGFDHSWVVAFHEFKRRPA